MTLKYSFPTGLVLTALLMAAATMPLSAADSKESSADKERQLLQKLQSGSPAEKALACKHLAIYGSESAVPALAPLLADPQLASWARIALEAIPGTASDEALRSALPKLQGKLLVGAINSIGVRHDAKAVAPLAGRVTDQDPEVASAAAVALGKIGGDKATKTLQAQLGKAPGQVRSAVAQGCILCAEKFLTAGNFKAAVQMYDSVRKAQVPKQRILEGTRGAILARKNDGLPLLLETLRSQDKGLFAIGLSTARELPGEKVSRELAAELARTRPERQPMLLLALADRGDAVAMSTVVQSAKTGSPELQLTAVRVLEQKAEASALPVLVGMAGANEPELRQAVVTALTRLPGNTVDADLLRRIPQSSGNARLALIEVAGLRQVNGAVPLLMPLMKDSDTATRSAAVQAIGILGSERELPSLLAELEHPADGKQREAVESALLSISSRIGAPSVPQLAPLARSADSSSRIAGLRALAAAGGSDALKLVCAATDDKDESVQDEAVRTLSSWPNTWPEDDGVAEPLLTLANSGKKTSYQVLAVRGYLQYVQGDKKLNDEQKVTKVSQLMPMVKRAEEKRLLISTVRDNRSPGLLPLLLPLASDNAVADDACSAILAAASRDSGGLSKEDRRKAVETVLEHAKKESTRRKANELLESLK